MFRASSHFIFCSPEQILRQSVVEQNADKQITRLFSLNERTAETSHTLFFDGIISGDFFSIKQHNPKLKMAEFTSDYHYLDFSGEIPLQVIEPLGKPLILDFGTTDVAHITAKLTELYPFISLFSIFEIIAACTYYPAIFLNRPAELSPNRLTKLILWENTDLVNKHITPHTRIRIIS